jgi:hypothetical protein
VRVHLIYKAIAHDGHYLLDIWLLHEYISRAGALGAQKVVAAIDIPIPWPACPSYLPSITLQMDKRESVPIIYYTTMD